MYVLDVSKKGDFIVEVRQYFQFDCVVVAFKWRKFGIVICVCVITVAYLKQALNALVDFYFAFSHCRCTRRTCVATELLNTWTWVCPSSRSTRLTVSIYFVLCIFWLSHIASVVKFSRFCLVLTSWAFLGEQHSMHAFLSFAYSSFPANMFFLQALLH